MSNNNLKFVNKDCGIFSEMPSNGEYGSNKTPENKLEITSMCDIGCTGIGGPCSKHTLDHISVKCPDNTRICIDKATDTVGISTVPMNQELNYKNWLLYIKDIAYDRDGYTSAKDLGELVDELRDMAIKGLQDYECPIDFYHE